MAALDDPVQQPGERLWAARRLCRRPGCSGPMSRSTIEAYDETQHGHRCPGRYRENPRGRRRASSALSASSRTSFRARSISAAQFRAAGLPVVIGGFHVSGCISMLPELPADLKAALDLGITLYAGEAEGRMAALLRDIDSGALKPIYNYLHDLPDMGSAIAPSPAARVSYARRRTLCELRRRPRLSVPVQLLHHHQRAGPQVALSHGRRRRGRSCAPMRFRASRGSSSPTTTLPATRTGRRSSTG